MVGARDELIEAAIWHGDLEPAERLLAAHPELRSSDIQIAAILGDAEAVRRFIALDPKLAIETSGPYGADALNYLALSKYLRLDRSRTDAFLEAATALLDAGADPNTGFWTTGSCPERETALYGAAGVAHHAPLTRLLLERGADPCDEEAVYHSPESYDNDAMKLLVQTGKLSHDDLLMMLIRKHDVHDLDGAKWLLEQGVDPGRPHKRGFSPLHHALARCNCIEMLTLLLDYGADPHHVKDGLSAVSLAAREGRGDLLGLLERRRVPLGLHGVDRLIAACARGDAQAARSIAADEPALVPQLIELGGTLLAKFAGAGNLSGVRLLVDFGVDVAAPFTEGDAYFDEAKGCLAIHVAAWRARPGILALLIERGSPVDVPDPKGRNPLALAVRACVDSYWKERASPDSVKFLLDAGAPRSSVALPTGHAIIDELLRASA